MNTSTLLNTCLACGSKHLKTILDLNEQPLANSFKAAPGDFEEKFPLKLNLCTDCTHLQLSHAVNPDLLFKNYLYVSGTSQTLRDYFDWFAAHTLEYFSEKPSTVLDIACNDGSQLNSFKALGLKTFGVDPAENLHKLSSVNHTVICDYLKHEHVDTLGKVDIINAQNVFAHNSYPLEFLQICKSMMHDKSRLFIQTSQADMVRNNEFDTIYHEHLSFFNASSMDALAKRAGLYLISIEKTPIHGNSYVFVFSSVPADNSKVQDVLADERKAGLQNLVTYDVYAERCKKVVVELKKTIEQYRNDGYTIAGYGAAAKGNTLLNFADLKLDFVVDDNPLKQGLYTPGTDIPVVSADVLPRILNTKVAFVPLAWNFFTEIRKKIKAGRNNDNDVFIRYFPEVKIEK